MDINFSESAQYCDFTSKPSWFGGSGAMLLIDFYTCNFRKSQSFTENAKIKCS